MLVKLKLKGAVVLRDGHRRPNLDTEVMLRAGVVYSRNEDAGGHSPGTRSCRRYRIAAGASVI